MSEAAHVPFTETKAPEAPERLNRGALRLIDISASTMANIGPAYSFYFGFGLLVITAGIAAPLTIIAAIVAIALLGNTLSQFSRAQPSTGGFITFVGKTFGGTSAVTTAPSPSTTCASRRSLTRTTGSRSPSSASSWCPSSTPYGWSGATPA